MNKRVSDDPPPLTTCYFTGIKHKDRGICAKEEVQVAQHNDDDKSKIPEVLFALNIARFPQLFSELTFLLTRAAHPISSTRNQGPTGAEPIPGDFLPLKVPPF